MDIEHTREKTPGRLRVGVFGDSYVESIQVPLEQTFFRRLAALTEKENIDVLAFGVSGWGTLHSMMAYELFGPRFDLDLVVYLFVKNDPGDHLASIQHGRYGKVTRKPAATLADNSKGFTIAARKPNHSNLAERTFYSQIEQKSFLVRAIRSRWRAYSAGFVPKNKHEKVTTATPGVIPNQNDLPSTWPPQMLEEAKLLTSRLLSQFRDSVESDGRRFMVLHVPQGNKELEGDFDEDDKWLPWLRETCKELDIRLIDTVQVLAEHHSRDNPMFDDHWSPAGHEVISELLKTTVRSEFLP